MNFQILSYHTNTDHGSYHLPAVNDAAAFELAALWGVSGVLFRHWGYLDGAGIHHIMDVREVWK